jgi:hypothetical protein
VEAEEHFHLSSLADSDHFPISFLAFIFRLRPACISQNFSSAQLPASASLFLSFLFDPEDEGGIVFRNVGLSPIYTSLTTQNAGLYMYEY